MAIYICEDCGEMIDDDYSPCVEHPTDSTAYCCEECAENLQMDEDFKREREAYNREQANITANHCKKHGY